ncbi:inosine/xanthosine triphosphatase [Haladaptatus litoreus]|uniref:Probable inosine/xanthosine triphosphatase n=1 Tax=Haladaptatus litoreus TaxID=553468 RepID=A0A1N6VI13_9EURY|nr:inosine/xanthosine triphosphatase [Haladaptatus litoreus]SIQ77378.1 inosine/xanthosine triphosphatase [Haladaptatus litoreus]
MRVGVGSRNPVKIAAVDAVFDSLDTTPEPVVVESVPVESGVSEQPFGEAETVAGAENRARRAQGGQRDDSEYDLGIGLEGGVAEVPDSDGLYLIMWAAVTDGETVGRGAGPRLQLPDAVARRIRDDEELGPVMDDLLGESNVAKKQGAAGALTAGVIDRQEALEHAVAGALAPFVTDFY